MYCFFTAEEGKNVAFLEMIFLQVVSSLSDWTQ